jgi:hypothetical protein
MLLLADSNCTASHISVKKGQTGYCQVKATSHTLKAWSRLVEQPAHTHTGHGQHTCQSLQIPSGRSPTEPPRCTTHSALHTAWRMHTVHKRSVVVAFPCRTIALHNGRVRDAHGHVATDTDCTHAQRYTVVWQTHWVQIQYKHMLSCTTDS